MSTSPSGYTSLTERCVGVGVGVGAGVVEAKATRQRAGLSFIGRGVALLTAAGLATSLLSCASDTLGSGEPDGGMDGGGSMTYTDLPSAPIGGGTLTPTQVATAAAAFAAAGAGSGGGPCLTEPSLDAMFPNNFSPPLFEWTVPPSQNIFELRLHVDNQSNDLLVYSDKPTFTLSNSLWAALAVDSSGHDITVTLRSGQLQGSALVGGALTGSTGNIHIAPVSAPGAVVYWTTSGGSALKGFHIGDATVQTVLTPASMRAALAGDNTQCIGCHTSSPDGLTALMGRSPSVNNFPFSIDVRLVDGTAARPSATLLTPNAINNLARAEQYMPTMSPALFTSTAAPVVTVGGNTSFNLIWTDLRATSGGTGTVARNGDNNNADSPSFAKNGQQLVYTSTNVISITPSATTRSDLYTVPWNNGAGGQATPLPGASDPNFNEFFPAYSPSDTFIGFNRAPAPGIIYDTAPSEVFLIPSAGGTATRLAANDPPACSGVKSPGLTNSYVRWAPQVMPYNNQRYYWLVFSSKRRPNPMGGAALPQLFLSVVVTQVLGATETLMKTYPAIYIPTQVSTESNHTPAWDNFVIPIG